MPEKLKQEIDNHPDLRIGSSMNRRCWELQDIGSVKLVSTMNCVKEADQANKANVF
jgi:hypothetical protein